MPFGAAQAILLAVVRRYRFGSEIEDQIKQMQPPKPQDQGEKALAQEKASNSLALQEKDLQIRGLQAEPQLSRLAAGADPPRAVRDDVEDAA